MTKTSVAQGLAADATNLYWTELYTDIFTCQKSNCMGTRKQLASGLTNLCGAAVYGANVFVVQCGAAGKVLSCPANMGGCVPTVIAQNLDSPRDIEADATGVYFTTLGKNPATDAAVNYCPLSGCVGVPRQLISGLAYVNGITLDDQAVYVTSSGSPIMGVAKP